MIMLNINSVICNYSVSVARSCKKYCSCFNNGVESFRFLVHNPDSHQLCLIQSSISGMGWRWWIEEILICIRAKHSNKQVNKNTFLCDTNKDTWLYTEKRNVYMLLLPFRLLYFQERTTLKLMMMQITLSVVVLTTL